MWSGVTRGVTSLLRCVLCCDSSAVCAFAAGWGCWKGHSSCELRGPGRWTWLAKGMASGLSFCAECVQLGVLTRRFIWRRRGAAVGYVRISSKQEGLKKE